MKIIKFSPTQIAKILKKYGIEQNCTFMAFPLTITNELVNKLINVKFKKVQIMVLQ